MGATVTGRGVDGRTPARARARPASPAGFEVGRRAAVTTTVLDTFDGRLARAPGCASTHRDGALVLHDGDGTVAGAAVRRPGPRVRRRPRRPGRSAARLADIIEVRALLPLVDRVDRDARRAERRNATARSSPSSRIHERLAVRSTATSTGGSSTVDELTGYDEAGRAEARERRRRRTSADRGERDAVDVVLADRRHRSAPAPRRPGRSRSTPTSRRSRASGSSSPTSTSAIEVNRQGTIDDIDPRVPPRPARRRAPHPLDPAPRPPRARRPTCWRGPSRASSRSATSRARRGTSTCRCSSGTTSSPSSTTTVARALEPLRRQLERRPRRGPRRARRRTAVAGDVDRAARPLAGVARRRRSTRPPAARDADRAVARRRAAPHREGPAPPARARPGDHARRRRPRTSTTCARTPRSCATSWSASPACSRPTSARRSSSG